ncbi:MAG: hypothetical protein U1F81_15225 [Verrucomicrobiaceae bacterium]
MKRLLIPLLLTSTLAAQQVQHGSPPAQSTSQRIFFAVDINADTKTDVVVIEKGPGTFLKGSTQPDGTLQWSAAENTGITAIETAAMARFSGGAQRDLAVTRKDFNRLQFVPLDGSDLPASVGLALPEPTALAAYGLDIVAPVPAATTFITGYAGSSGLSATDASQFPPVRWTSRLRGANPRLARSIYGSNTPLVPLIGFIADAASGPLGRLQLLFADDSGESLTGEITGIPADSRFAAGFFSHDLSKHGLTTGAYSTTIFTYSATSTLLSTSRLTNIDWGNGNALLPAVTFFPLGTHDLGRPVLDVVALSESPPRLLVLWADATGGASVFDWDGNTAPVLAASIPMNGMTPETALPLADGDFLLMGNRGGQLDYDRIHRDGSSYSRTATGTVPATPVKPLYSNIITFGSEPFVDPEAYELSRRRVRDFTVGAVVSGLTANVTSLVDGGASAGLGCSSASTVSVPQDTTHTLVSQLDAASSFMLLSNATTAIASGLSQVRASPPPGTYSGPTLDVTLASGGAFEATVVTYSIDGGSWQQGQIYNPVHLTLSANSTIRAYLKPPGFFGAGQSPIQTFVFNLSTFPTPTVQPVTDTNNNGLSDAWENLTGITNPGGDADGDGFLNLAEHNSGFDPLSALSKPDAVAVAPNLNLFNNPIPAQNTLRWDASDTAVILEGSDDLQNWTVVTQGITRQGGENVFTLPVSIVPKAFYRLRR